MLHNSSSCAWINPSILFICSLSSHSLDFISCSREEMCDAHIGTTSWSPAKKWNGLKKLTYSGCPRGYRHIHITWLFKIPNFLFIRHTAIFHRCDSITEIVQRIRNNSLQCSPGSLLLNLDKGVDSKFQENNGYKNYVFTEALHNGQVLDNTSIYAKLSRLALWVFKFRKYGLSTKSILLFSAKRGFVTFVRVLVRSRSQTTRSGYEPFSSSQFSLLWLKYTISSTIYLLERKEGLMPFVPVLVRSGSQTSTSAYELGSSRYIYIYIEREREREREIERERERESYRRKFSQLSVHPSCSLVFLILSMTSRITIPKFLSCKTSSFILR